MIIIGKFLKNYGVRGHIKVKFFLDDLNQVYSFKDFFLKDQKKIELKFLKKIKEIFICEVNKYTSIEKSKFFTGKFIYINKKELPELKKDYYYYHELEGLDVRLDDKKVGKVISINNHGAGDYFEIIINNGKEEVLVPKNNSHIIEINIGKNFLKLNPMYYKNEI